MLRSGSDIVIATRNAGKVKEFAPLFMEKGMTVKSLLDFGDMPDIVEDGQTFAENARIKARTIALRLGIPVVADDSGLCVDKLDGEPGVFSARYAGEHASDEQNNSKLLERLSRLGTPPLAYGDAGGAGAPASLSGARFVCAICLADGEGRPIVEVEADCPGGIIAEPRGANGFGYDPLFYLPEFGQTMAELDIEQKNKISHRGQAIRKLWQALDA
ncbi:non-canonical purine NTP pyrophosphatase [Paenibacillus piri]|uniref:dITP/XTP pyrophosphatase n=1 Tax=Paenibacillus piri TaxID=2547395 RepID=A0A4R5KS01_9BACL|nr:non-canonical purine NTP pyrophosphatase [Paenibacillus piri]TDF97600.1 non-canonical purine NTP pyrophosphatase [Paenibacillus piri]